MDIDNPNLILHGNRVDQMGSHATNDIEYHGHALCVTKLDEIILTFIQQFPL